MTLSAQLNADGLIQPFLSGLAGQTSSVGELHVSIDVSVATDASAHAESAQPTGFGPVIAQIVERMRPLLARLPIAGDVLGPVSAALDTFESLATGQLLTDLSGAFTAIQAEVEGTGEGLPALVLRVLDVLSGNPATAGIGELAKLLFRTVGAPSLPGPVAKVRDVVAALDGISRVLGGEMSLETVLAEGDRLTTLVARQLDRDDIARLIAAADAGLGSDGSLAAFVRGLDPDQPADVAAALAAIKHARASVDRLVEGLATGMGLGEATLLYLDVETMQREVDRGLALIRDTDLAPAKRLIAEAMAWLQPFLARIDLDAIPELTLEVLLTQIEGAIGNVAAGISSIDTAGAVRPVADVLARIADVARTVADALDAVVQEVRQAIGTIRDVVAALPIDAVADAIRTVLAPISAALDFLDGAIGAIGDTIGDVANDAIIALRAIEGAVDKLIEDVDLFFGAAKKFIDDLHIDQVLGEVADKIRAFADLIGRAQLKPSFDTAVGAIGTAADVVSALPFDLLPESMKADVDAAVKPIKDVDIAAFETQVEAILQITPDGKLALRDDLTDGIQALQAKYDAVIQVVRDNHPRKYVQQLDIELAKLAAKLRDVEPGLTLAPLTDAIDQIKAAVAGFDLVAALAPVQAVFQQIFDAIDQYNPAQLLQPVEQRLDQLRTQFVDTLKIDRWVTTLTGLRDQGLARIDAFDPARHTDRIATLLDGAHRALADLPAGSILGPLGHVVCMLLSATQLRLHPDSFAPVVGWLRGGSASAALDAHTQAIGDAVAATHASVTTLELGPIGTRLGAAATDLRAAIATHPADSALRAQLELAMIGFDPQASFLALIANRARYVALLARAAAAAEGLRRTGFSLAREGIDRLRDAFAPGHVFTDLGRTALGKLGIHDLDRGLRGVVDDILAAATPARLAGLGSPIIVAIRERLRALVDAVLAPVIDGAHQVERAVATIDLTPIVEAIQGVVDEAKHQLEQLSPMTLLAAPIASFVGLQAQLAAFDPLGPLLDAFDELKATIRRLVGDPPEVTADRVEGKLTAERLLQVPLAIADEILDAFAALDLETLLTPVLDALDGLAHEVDDGLDRTVTAFKHLQDALPSGGGGSSVTVSASVGGN